MLLANDEKTEVILFTSKHGWKSLPNIAVSVGEQQQRDHPPSVISGYIRPTSKYYPARELRIAELDIITSEIYNFAAKSLVRVLVTSRLDYCNSILRGLPVNRLAKMQRLQNACASISTRTSRRSRITPVLKELHWFPVHSRIQYKIMSQTSRAIHHQAPNYLSDMLSIYRPTRSLRSESTISLTVPRTRTATYGDRTFRKAAATVWNNLPANIRNSNSCSSFQRQLKTFIFRQEYTI